MSNLSRAERKARARKRKEELYQGFLDCAAKTAEAASKAIEVYKAINRRAELCMIKKPQEATLIRQAARDAVEQVSKVIDELIEEDKLQEGASSSCCEGQAGAAEAVGAAV